MAEYIEREALLQDIEECVRFSAKTGTISAEMRGANKIIDRIKCAPAADIVLRVHGRWISDESDVLFHCSLCETQISTSWDYDDLHWNYCPNCGAKMVERKEK